MHLTLKYRAVTAVQPCWAGWTDTVRMKLR